MKKKVKKVKVDIHNGVYVHSSSNLFTVELGEMVHNETGEVKPAIKTFGVSIEGLVVEKTFTLDDLETTHNFCKVVLQSEYLGEL